MEAGEVRLVRLDIRTESLDVLPQPLVFGAEVVDIVAQFVSLLNELINGGVDSFDCVNDCVCGFHDFAPFLYARHCTTRLGWMARQHDIRAIRNKFEIGCVRFRNHPLVLHARLGLRRNVLVLLELVVA